MNNKSSISAISLFFVYTLFVVYECSRMYAGIEELDGNLTAFGTVSTFPILLLVFSLFFLGLEKTRVRDKNFKAFLAFFIISYFLTLIWAIFFHLTSRIVLFSSFLPLVFWYIGNNLNDRRKDKTISFYVPLCFFLLFAYFILRYDRTSMLDQVYAAINASYAILYLLPFVLLSPKRYVRIIAILLTLAATFLTLKRGGMISLSIGLLFYVLSYGKVTSGKVISFRGVILAAIAIVGVVYLVIYFNNSMEGLVFNRFAVIEQDQGSGRTSLYQHVEQLIFESSVLGWIFGHGWDGVARASMSGLSAHNDFLEILYDFGIVAFICYVIFIVRMFRHLIKLLKCNHGFAPAMAASLGIFISNSFVSHIYIYAWYMLIFTWFWGFVIRDTYDIVNIKHINK